MLESLAKYHILWCSFVSKRCEDKMYVEDLVQEMYLKAIRTKNNHEIVKEGEVNKSYVFRMLSGLVIDYHRAKNRVSKTQLQECTEDHYRSYTDSLDLDELNQRHETHLIIREKLREHHTYYERMYLMRTDAENPSIRELARTTEISKGTICHDLKKIRNIIENEEPRVLRKPG